MMLDPIGIVVDHALSPVVFADSDLANTAPGSNLDSAAHGRRPVGNIGTALGPLGAASETRPQVDAGSSPGVFDGGNGAIRWPPVPSEPIEAAPESLAHLAEGHGRQGNLFRRIRGIARQPGHSHHHGVLVVVGFERGVVERPIFTDAVQ